MCYLVKVEECVDRFVLIRCSLNIILSILFISRISSIPSILQCRFLLRFIWRFESILPTQVSFQSFLFFVGIPLNVANLCCTGAILIIPLIRFRAWAGVRLWWIRAICKIMETKEGSISRRGEVCPPTPFKNSVPPVNRLRIIDSWMTTLSGKLLVLFTFLMISARQPLFQYFWWWLNHLLPVLNDDLVFSSDQCKWMVPLSILRCSKRVSTFTTCILNHEESSFSVTSRQFFCWPKR